MASELARWFREARRSGADEHAALVGLARRVDADVDTIVRALGHAGVSVSLPEPRGPRHRPRPAPRRPVPDVSMLAHESVAKAYRVLREVPRSHGESVRGVSLAVGLRAQELKSLLIDVRAEIDREREAHKV